MLKRKYGNRSGWKRIINRSYAQALLDTEEFKGYITLLHAIKVTDPLFVRYANKNMCIVDDGYMWLQQFPLGRKHSITTMFDAKGNIVQWYIDICLEIGVDGDVPWMDDLFLDIVLLPSGELFHKDIAELREAFLNGIIDKQLHDLAWEEASHLTELIINKKLPLLDLSNKHKQMLMDKLE